MSKGLDCPNEHCEGTITYTYKDDIQVTCDKCGNDWYIVGEDEIDGG